MTLGCREPLGPRLGIAHVQLDDRCAEAIADCVESLSSLPVGGHGLRVPAGGVVGHAEKHQALRLP
jgi:hypothetical protein